MDIRHFFSASRALIVAGKGGVGKTIVSRALATVATGAGMGVLHVEIDGKSGEEFVVPGVDRLRLSAGTALSEYLQGRGLGVLTRQLDRLGIVDVVASTAPGIDDLLVLGKIKQLVREDPHDVIIIDGPAAGHAVDLLRAPRVMKRTVLGGPIAQQADDVLQMFASPAAFRTMLVTKPAVTPVQELVETAAGIRDLLGVSLAPVVVNGIHPPLPAGVTASRPALGAAVEYVTTRHRAELTAMTLLSESLPLEQLHAGHHVASGNELVALVAGDLTDAIGEIR